MEGIKNQLPPHIDYQAAAERLLVALSFIAEQAARRKVPNRPIPAINLCCHTFDSATRLHWSRETKRRRIRDAVDHARKLLAAQASDPPSPSSKIPQLIGSGAGYMLDADPRVIAWYAARRRKAALSNLAAEKQTKQVIAHRGQASLFPQEAAHV